MACRRALPRQPRAAQGRPAAAGGAGGHHMEPAAADRVGPPHRRLHGRWAIELARWWTRALGHADLDAGQKEQRGGECALLFLCRIKFLVPERPRVTLKGHLHPVNPGADFPAERMPSLDVAFTNQLQLRPQFVNMHFQGAFVGGDGLPHLRPSFRRIDTSARAAHLRGMRA